MRSEFPRGSRQKAFYLATVSLALTFSGVAAKAQALTASAPTVIDPQRMFVFLFLMLGPIKILVPFVQMTRQSDESYRRRLGNRAILLSAAALLLASAVGDSMIRNFGIPLPVLVLTGGLILFLVALKTVLEQFSPRSAAEPGETPREIGAAAGRLAFPTVVTPSGIAALIVFSALAKNDLGVLATIAGVCTIILVFDWLAMRFAEPILSWARVPLQLFAVILGVIQVSLGLQLVLRGLSLSGALPGVSS